MTPLVQLNQNQLLAPPRLYQVPEVPPFDTDEDRIEWVIYQITELIRVLKAHLYWGLRTPSLIEYFECTKQAIGSSTVFGGIMTGSQQTLMRERMTELEDTVGQINQMRMT